MIIGAAKTFSMNAGGQVGKEKSDSPSQPVWLECHSVRMNAQSTCSGPANFDQGVPAKVSEALLNGTPFNRPCIAAKVRIGVRLDIGNRKRPLQSPGA